ncbi:MAG: phosphoribosylformylglycinamidine cyclo-ligase [Candidatus Pacebacteria bacterium]|nr:phosphoribosylformylglycinamidine cyclo-ligase [Candidatus Paceibacterota bacterium]
MSIIDTYSKAGVDTEQEESSMSGLINHVKRTWPFSGDIAKVKLDIGFFANVLDIGNGIGLAISADGVGTKILVAQMMDKYDTVGIDCIAMNVNDILCVGARPITMVDYIAVQNADPWLLNEIGKGLYEGAKIANVNIPGGELAQVKDMIRGPREGFGFDLVGMSAGIVPIDKLIVGEDLKDGDVIIGIKSNGIHSNGLTLARKVLLEEAGFSVGKYIDDLGTTLGEELLKPTHIYVKEVLEIIECCKNVKSLIHITSDGFLNLPRVKSNVSYIIDNLPDIPPIFNLIQNLGEVPDEEMFTVYNMGIGFCVIVAPNDVDQVFSILKNNNRQAYKIGYIVGDGKSQVTINPRGLIGSGKRFHKF